MRITLAADGHQLIADVFRAIIDLCDVRPLLLQLFHCRIGLKHILQGPVGVFRKHRLVQIHPHQIGHIARRDPLPRLLVTVVERQRPQINLDIEELLEIVPQRRARHSLRILYICGNGELFIAFRHCFCLFCRLSDDGLARLASCTHQQAQHNRPQRDASAHNVLLSP